MRPFFRYQGYHLAAYLLLGALLYAATAVFPQDQRTLWGLSTGEWILASWVLAAVHQGWILFFWRMELFYGSISAWFGKAGFPFYKVGYLVWGFARLLCVIPISQSSRHTDAIPSVVSVALIVVTTPVILWVAWSFAFYFGLDRAAGADHFDPAYRTKPLESRGAFKYFRNPGYALGLLLLYHPGLFWHSSLGLIAAAAHHAFVWVAYLCSEKPDLDVIYGGGKG